MQTIYKSYKYRIYPTVDQKSLLAKHFGAARFIYNLALETKIEAYKKGVNLSCYQLQKQVTDLKKECAWLNEVSIGALERPIANLEEAFKNFFKGAGFPAFKKKRNSASYTVRQDMHIRNGLLCIPKFQQGNGFKIILHRPFNGKIKSITISKTPTGKYFASLLTEAYIVDLPKNNNVVGIDLGIKTFAVLSDGKEYANPQFLRKSLNRLKVLQRRASKKLRGSVNQKKANLKSAKLYEKITNQRQHFLHTVSNEITNHNGTICIEDLSISNMQKNHCLALSIGDTGWGAFVNMLQYKSSRKGRQLVTIGRFIPTSKTCSNCGSIKDMPLSERTYSCECGLVLDRDVNASRNIRNAGILRTEASVELLPLGKTVKQKSCRRTKN